MDCRVHSHWAPDRAADGGAVIIETIFSIPGIGHWVIDSIQQRDFPVVQGISLVMAVSVLLANLLADIAYAYIDPRIHYR